MTARERVLRALKIAEGLPDRVPVQFDLCRQHIEYFGNKLGIPTSFTENYYEDITCRISANEIRLAMGSDIVVTGPSVSADFTNKQFADGTWINEFGMRMKEGQIYVDVVEHPLKDAACISDIEAYHLPDPYAPGRYDDVERMVKKYKEDYFIIGDIELTVFSLAEQLLGMEKYLMDLAMEEEYIEALHQKCADFQIAVGCELIKRGVDAIWVGDGFGSQENMLISPGCLKERIIPHYARMIAAYKELNPDIVMILHCDGAVKKALPYVCDVGFSVFNPVQPNVPGHSAQELKNEFGDRLTFFGAIDQQYLLPRGTEQELADDIKSKIETLGAGGGYIIAPAHIIQSDVSPERVERFIEMCYQYGSIYG